MILKRSHQKLRRRNQTPLFVFLFLFPYIVGFTADSTSAYSEVLFGAGTGQYVYHDCAGAHTRTFTDAGAYVGKKFEGPYRIGLAAGTWKDGTNRTTFFAFPDLALDWKSFSLGTTGIRIGSRNSFYLEGKWLDQPPFQSGKGALRAGIGFLLKDSGTRMWFGTNVIPYNAPGAAAQFEFPLQGNKFLFFNCRLGSENENGISVGMRIISF
jgi:hypothetical protein